MHEPAERPIPAQTDLQSPAPGERSFAERVVKATFAIALAHGIAKLLGIVQSSVISSYFTLNSELVDAFVIAYEGILLPLFLIGEESIAPVFLPLFLALKNKESEERAWRFASTLLNLHTCLLVVVIGAVMLFPGFFIELITRSKPIEAIGNTDNLRNTMSVAILVASAPALLGLSLGSITYMLLNGYKLFFWPAFADAALKAGLVAGIILGSVLGLDLYALVLGVLLSGFAKIVVHLYALGSRLKGYRLRLDLSDPQIKRFAILILPLLVGIVFAKFRDNFNNIFMLTHLETGTIAINSWGRKIYNAVANIIPYPLAIAMFPFLCDLVSKEDRRELAAFLTRASRMILVFFMPLAGIVMALSVPLAQALFRSSKTSAEVAAMTGQVNACYTLVLPFVALEMIFMQAYFSAHRTYSVVIIGLLFSTLSVAISYVGIEHFGLQGLEAVMLVALGFALSRALKALALITYLRLSGLEIFPFGETLQFSIRCLLLTALCAFSAWGLLQIMEAYLPDFTQLTEDGKFGLLQRGKLIVSLLLLPGTAAVLAFIISCRLLKMTELDAMLAYARQKLQRRRSAI